MQWQQWLFPFDLYCLTCKAGGIIPHGGKPY
jgi:hypothetical protein